MVISGETVLPEAEILFPAREGGTADASCLQKVARRLPDNSQVARVELGIESGRDGSRC